MREDKNQQSSTVFENIGGSFQYHARSTADLEKVLTLDPSVWAALCVPVSALNGDAAFFRALDGDGNGTIRVDEVKAAVRWFLEVEKDAAMVTADDVLSQEELDPDSADGAMLGKFIAERAGLAADGKTVKLEVVRAQLAALTAGPLRGDGVLSEAAANGSGGEALYADIVKLLGAKAGLAKADFETFLANAKAFLDWAKTTEKPLFRMADPVKYFDAYKAVETKLDEYFRFCDLVRIDKANAKRFELDPANLPALDLTDPAAVDAVLESAPLAAPTAECVIDLAAPVNPVYEAAIKNFAAAFGVTKLTAEEWRSLKAEFAGYIDYLKKAQGDLAGSLGREKLEAYLAGPEPEALRKVYARDQELGGVLDALRKLERLLLFKKYLLEFVNNFVSFEAFFNPDTDSMLQAGRLVMDGHSYHLAVWITDAAAHRKIAMRSNLCLLYLEVTSSGTKPVTRKVAVAVTGGTLSRIYVGKPAFFAGSDGITYHGKVTDLVEGPISFWQTVLAPMRRLSDTLGDKIQKLTDFSSTEKQLADAIEQGKAPVIPAPAPERKGWLGNGSVLLLAGGLSVAAIGAAASYALKALSGAIATISALQWWVILLWIAFIIAVFLVPSAIFAWLKMHKRNLTLFLEAGGWAVNLPMRLTMTMSGIFTHGATYPEGAKFQLIRKKGLARVWVFLVLVILIAAAAYLTCRRVNGCGASCSAEVQTEQTAPQE